MKAVLLRGLAVAILWTAFLFCALISLTHAADYSSPSLAQYYSSLYQPDAPGISCCGPADGYYADKTEACPPGAFDCAFVAVITDTRPDKRMLADGFHYSRKHVPVGTKIPVPPSKVRKHPVPNPTGHNLIFISGDLNVYCWEPQPGI